MKDARKSGGSFNIRQNSKRISREQPNKTKTSLMSEVEKKRKTLPKFDLQMQKQFIKAENISPQEEEKIRKQAQKTVNKKAKGIQMKIENQLIKVLQLECNKMGEQLEGQRMQNQKLRFEVSELRKNIEFLNSKLQNIYKDNQHLSKNNDYGKMEKDQLRDQLQKTRAALQRSDEEKQHLKQSSESKIDILSKETETLKEINLKLKTQIKNVRQQKQEIEEELEEKNQQYNYVRQQFEERKRQWDRIKQQMESQSRDNMDKKGEKITKFQVQLQGLNDKLRQQENLRKKITEKNKELDKQLIKKGEIVKDMEEQIVNLKKRINDLSILKSSNNAILNQKLTQLTEQNLKLKKDIESLSKKGVVIEEETSKPFLFGPEDDD